MSIRKKQMQAPPLGGVLIAALATLINLSACASDSTSSNDRSSTREASGHAVDADTNEPIPNAWIFEAVPRGTRGADVRRASSARWTRTDAQGRYAFQAGEAFSHSGEASSHSGEASSLGGLIKSPAARYHFYHPSYGLLRGREAGKTPTVFRPSLRDAHLRQADLAATTNCAATRSDTLDPMAAQLAKLACPPGIADRFPNGGERARGALDDRGRRDGAWEFFREDGTLQARGHYAAGAAIAPWTFFSASEPPS